MSDVFETRTVTGPNGVEYKVEFSYDYDYGPPQKNSDGHGVILCTSWTKTEALNGDVNLSDDLLMRVPGFRLLTATRSSYMYYDTVASAAKAIEEWGCKPEEVERAVEWDFRYIDGWYSGQWNWIVITVTRVNDEDATHSCGGFESTMLDNEDELAHVVADLICIVEWEHKRNTHPGQLELQLA